MKNTNLHLTAVIGLHLLLVLLMISSNISAQTNPTAQNLPYVQNFGTTTFTSMPLGTSAWTVASSPKGSQSSAESSTPSGNATITAATTTQTTGNCYGYATSGNGRLYIQTSSNSTNGTNQLAAAIVTTNLQNIKVSYDIEMISAQSRTAGVVLQYRIGTSGSWTTVSGSVYAHNSNDRNAGQVDNFSNLGLPPAANDNAVVQLRWAVWRGSESGNSSGIGIDHIQISGSAIPTIYYFRSKQTGNWHDTLSWEMSTDNSNWVNATFIPNYNCKTITIQSGHNITMIASDTIDQLIVNGTFIYNCDTNHVLTINNGSGVDLTINGTFEDSGSNSIVWLNTPTWEMGSSGTLIKTQGTSSNNWRDHYNAGISNIPSTAYWILRKTGGSSPALTTVGGMYYPNLTIENNTGTTWTTGNSSSFTGSSDYPRIKGNLDIGGNGSGNVSFKSENTNSNAVLVQGDLLVKSGSTLRNYGTGFEVQGNLNINGTISYDSTGARKIIMSGGNSQSITGTGTFNIYDLVINKSANNVSLSKTITIDHQLTLTAGKIILGSYDLILGTTASISGNSSSNYINTNSTGKITKKYSTTGTAFTFPTGDGTYYTPYTLTLNSATLGSDASVSIRVINSAEPHITGYSDYAARYWDASTNNITNMNADVNYSYVNTDITGNENNFVAARWNATDSLKKIGTVNATTNTASGTSIKEAGNFTAAGICNLSAGISSSDPDNSLCLGATDSLTASAATAYLWSTSETTQKIFVSTSGTYTVTVSDKKGCSDSATVIVNVHSFPVANAGADTSICYGDSIHLTATGGGSGSFSYLWSTGNTTSTIMLKPDSTTSYIATVTNTYGCSAKDTVVVTVHHPVAETWGFDSICKGEMTYLFCFNGSTYVWNTGDSTDIVEIIPDSTTKYFVTITDEFGCKASDSLTVTVLGPPVADAGQDTSVCRGMAANLSASGGTWYYWSTDDFTQDIRVYPDTTSVYGVYVFDEHSCYAYDSVTVNVLQNPVVNAGQDKIMCAGMIDTLRAGGGPPYLWNTGATTDMISRIWDTAGTYIYTVTVTNTNGCYSSDTVKVTVNPIPVADAGADVSICEGLSDTLTATGGDNYYWYFLSAMGGNANTANLIVSPESTTTYTVVVSKNNCSITDSASVTVTVNDLPIADAGTDVAICYGATTNLTASGGTSYHWSTNETAATISVSPTVTTAYTVTVFDANGCSSTDDVNVTVNQLPTAEAGPDISLVAGYSDTLTATGGTNYYWSTGASTASIIVTPDSTTIYSVTVSDANACNASDFLTAYVCTTPVFNCPGYIVINYADSTYQLNTAIVPSVNSCGIISLYNNQPAVFPVDTTVVSWTAVEVNGDTMRCEENIIRNTSFEINSCNTAPILHADTMVTFEIINPYHIDTSGFWVKVVLDSNRYLIIVSPNQNLVSAIPTNMIIYMGECSNPEFIPDSCRKIGADSLIINFRNYVASDTFLLHINLNIPNSNECYFDIKILKDTSTYKDWLPSDCPPDNCDLIMNPEFNNQDPSDYTAFADNNVCGWYALCGSPNWAYLHLWAKEYGNYTMNGEAVWQKLINPPVSGINYTLSFDYLRYNGYTCQQLYIYFVRQSELSLSSSSNFMNLTLLQAAMPPSDQINSWKLSNNPPNQNQWWHVVIPIQLDPNQTELIIFPWDYHADGISINIANFHIIHGVSLSATPINGSCNTSVISAINLTTHNFGNPTYLWSNGATTENISNLPVGTYTYTVTVTDIDGCSASTSATVTTFQVPTVVAGISGNNPICEGTCTTLTATASNCTNCNYSWMPCNPSSPLTSMCNTASLNVCPTTTTTYTVTATNSDGCTASSAVTITVKPKPPAPTITGINNLCSGNILTYTATPLGYQLNWSIPDPNMGTFANNYQIPRIVNWNPNYISCDPTNPYHTGLLNCQTIDPNNDCYSDITTFEVYCCCNPSTPPTDPYTFRDVVINQPLFSNDNGSTALHFAGDIIINTDVVFDNCEIEMNPGTRIIVAEGNTLTINKTTLQNDCYLMWDGIYTEYNSSLVKIENSSTIQDAINGVVTTNGSPINITNSVFDQNLTSIQLKNYYNPNAIPLPMHPLVYPAFIAGNTFRNPAALPPNTNKKARGIYCEWVEGVTIGDATGHANYNEFYNLKNGIYSINSSISVYNNDFHDICMYPQNTIPPPLSSYCEGAIFAKRTATPTQQNPIVPGSVFISNPGNTQYPYSFKNCRTGIYLMNVSFTLENNEFNNIYEKAIYCQDKPRGGKAINNYFKNCYTGIQIESAIPANTNVLIDNNALDDCKQSIRIRNLKSWLNKVNNNVIMYSGGGNGVQEGIRVDNCLSANITNNLIAAGPNPPSTMNSLIGIGIYNTNNALLKENELDQLGTGIKGLGNLDGTKFACNHFKNSCYTGFYFGPTNTKISDQGTNQLASDNTWDNMFINYSRITGDLINGPFINWFYRTQISMYDLNLQPGSPISLDILPNPLSSTSLSWCDQLLHSKADINEQTENLNKIFEMDLDTISENTRHFYNSYLFNTVKEYEDDSINIDDCSFSDNVLNTYNQLLNSNFELFNEFNIAISDTNEDNTDLAININNEVQPENNIEQLRQYVNTIYANTWAKDIFELDSITYSTLSEIAYSVPELAGDAVYTARVMLGIDPLEANNRNMKQIDSDTINNKEFNLYPNPAENSINIVFTGDMKNLVDFSIEVFDIFGNKVKSITLTQTKEIIDIADLAQGVFLLRINQNSKSVYYNKFIKM